MSDLVGLTGLAAFHGVHYDTARKGWEGWVRTRGHPAPLSLTPPYRWRLSSLKAWQDRAEAENAVALCRAAKDDAAPPVSNDNRGGAAARRAIDRGRNLIAARMGAV